MNDALLVSRFQCFNDLLGDRECLVQRNRPLRDAIRQGWSLNQLHDDGRGAVALLQTVNGGDVRMIEPGEYFGFALETHQTLALGRHRLGQHLDGDGALQVGIGRAVYLAHALRRHAGVIPSVRSARPYNSLRLTLPLGTRLGPYEVVSAIGAGEGDS